MQELVTDLLPDVLTSLAVSVGSILFTILGLVGEQAGLADLMAGSTALGFWELFIGTWALFVGIYLLGIKQAVPRVRAVLAN